MVPRGNEKRKAGITQMKRYGNTRGSKKINICTEIVYTFTKARELNYSKESTEYYSKVLNKCLHKDSRCLHIHTDENKHTSILNPAWKFCFADVTLSGFKMTHIFAKNRLYTKLF